MTIGVLSVSLQPFEDAAVSRAMLSLERQGFGESFRFDWNDGRVRLHTDPRQPEAVHSMRSPAGVACCVGPLWYRGRFGEQALALLLEDVGVTGEADPRIDETELRGNFALFLHVGGRTWLLNDSLGFVRVYGSADGRFHSTSWLATRAYVGDSDIEESAAIEYVLLGATHHDRTVARGVGKLPLGFGLDLHARRRWARFPDGIVPDTAGKPRYASIEAAVESIGEQLRTSFREIAGAFPSRTSAALSGGFDSRLILAALLEQGERPRLFVYGDEQSEDVPIARAIAQGEGISLNVVDKGAMNRGFAQPGLEDLMRNALFFDGLPNDGIDDPGADRQTRLEQSAGGFIALNGGGGEIFRNFFHLPDRRYRARDIVHAFYRGFDAGVFRRAGGLQDYETGLARSIARSAGLPDVDEAADLRLTREQVELVYPFFRCHHWMGLNNSLSVRYGYFATPLVDLTLVRQAAALPLAWKQAGRFESRLIAALHPGVARHDSAYGFRFSDGPDARARRSEWLTGIRPVHVRPLINALRRRLHKERVSPQLVARCRAMLPGEWRLDPLLDLDRLPADDAFERALSVEVVSRELSP